MNVIHKFNRFELKYVLSIEQVEAFKKDLLQYVKVDPYGNEWKYRLESLYYDTKDYKHYWEKIEWLKYRRKIRIRRYVTDDPFDDESYVYIEIKQRIDRVTQKRRVGMRYREAKALLDEGIYPDDYRPEDKEVIDELHHLATSERLYPSAITCYDRQAYFGTENDIWLRVTFDTLIRVSKYCLALEESEKFPKSVFNLVWKI